MVQTQLPDPAKVLVVTGRDTGLLAHAVVEVEVALLHRPAHIQRDQQPQLMLAGPVALFVQQRHLRQDRRAHRQQGLVGGHRRHRQQRDAGGPDHVVGGATLEENIGGVLLHQLLDALLRLTVCPLLDGLHGHLLPGHLAAVDQHPADADVTVTVLAAVTQILQPVVIAIVNKARALHVHQEVVDKRLAVAQLQPAVGQRPLVDLGPGRTTAAAVGHGVDGVLVFRIRAVAHLQHRRVVTGEQHVAHPIRAPQLGQADAVAGNVGGIAAVRHPAGELVIEFAIAAGHLA